MFFKGNKRLPKGFEEVYICHLLNITYDELLKQPFDWVEKYLLFLQVKNKVEELELKKQQKKQSLLKRKKR